MAQRHPGRPTPPRELILTGLAMVAVGAAVTWFLAVAVGRIEGRAEFWPLLMPTGVIVVLFGLARAARQRWKQRRRK